MVTLSQMVRVYSWCMRAPFCQERFSRMGKGLGAIPKCPTFMPHGKRTSLMWNLYRTGLTWWAETSGLGLLPNGYGISLVHAGAV